MTRSSDKRLTCYPASKPTTQNMDDIVQAINEFLREPAEPGPSSEHATSTWPPAGPATSASRPPKVGTIIQRSDREQQRKREMLLQPPPPPPKRRQPPAPREEPPTAPPLLMPTGPTPPPPIPCQVAPGVVFDVPHFAVHVSRRYKIHSAEHGFWVLRFTRRGELRYTRRIR